MKKKSSNIIKSLLITAAFSLFHSSAEAIEPAHEAGGLNDANTDELSVLKKRVYTNILKMATSGNLYEVSSHRSHSSHSSHSSHRSSRSGHSSHYSSSHYSSSHYSSSSNAITSKKTSPAKSAKGYSLGDRTLKRGMYGSDVDELVWLLREKKYLDSRSITTYSGYYVYDEEVEQAVGYFQEDYSGKKGVVFSRDNAYILKNAQMCMKFRLGMRELKLGDTGIDVVSLIRILQKADFGPDQRVVKPGEDEYGEHVATAVKIFQAFNGLEVTGIVDYKTAKAIIQLDK